VFFYSNNSYFQTPPKKLPFAGEIPISLDFVDDCKAFIAGTSTKYYNYNIIIEINIKLKFQI
jgi:hypothetical protein